MKIALKFLTSLVFSIVVWVLIGAFIANNINPFEWSVPGRLSLVICILFTLLVIFIPWSGEQEEIPDYNDINKEL